MLNSKQRSNLRSLAQKIESIAQVGKGGISENSEIAVDLALAARELIKITVLENCESTAEEVGEAFAAKLKAELVCVTGRKVVLYRLSNKKGIKHIEY